MILRSRSNMAVMVYDRGRLKCLFMPSFMPGIGRLLPVRSSALYSFIYVHAFSFYNFLS